MSENNKIPEEILNILKATPCKKKEPSYPFKMPKSYYPWGGFEIELIKKSENDSNNKTYTKTDKKIE